MIAQSDNILLTSIKPLCFIGLGQSSKPYESIEENHQQRVD